MNLDEAIKAIESMTQDQGKVMRKQAIPEIIFAGYNQGYQMWREPDGFLPLTPDDGPYIRLDIPRDKLAAWMIENGFATGHGDTMADLLGELSWQIKELREKNETPS